MSLMRRPSRGFPFARRGVRFIGLAAVLAALGLAANWLIQVVRKPSELLFPVSATLTKTPAETWASYAGIFRKFSTRTLPPELLAALAQAEAAGNPMARTYWRWSPSSKPLDIYRPASSSVGMYQMTDGAFSEARQLCIRDHRVWRFGAADGNPCWFGGMYFRVLPSDAVELAAAFLDQHVALALARHHVNGASSLQKQHLATVIHLCGPGAADLYVRRGFQLPAAQRCGDHDPRAYLARVDALTLQFRELALAGGGGA